MSTTSSICRSRHVIQQLRLSRAPRRHASTSQSPSKTSPAVKVPPESPKFIYIPKPPQQDAVYISQRKGVLPTPRKVFTSIRVDRASSEYLDKVVPEPTKEVDLSALSPAERDLAEYKIRQSELRRKNLREGLRSLSERKASIEGQVRAASKAKQAAYERRVNAPEREDERLTNPSILAELMPGAMKVLPHPDLKVMLERKKTRHQRKVERKMEERKNALHTLYINAKDFIVNEAELVRRLDEEFDKPFYKENPGRSIWDEEGMPETASWLLTDGGSVSGGAVASGTEKMDLSAKRVKKIAEELTGGKM